MHDPVPFQVTDIFLNHSIFSVCCVQYADQQQYDDQKPHDYLLFISFFQANPPSLSSSVALAKDDKLRRAKKNPVAADDRVLLNYTPVQLLQKLLSSFPLTIILKSGHKMACCGYTLVSAIS
jgi:hypothetical protein